MLNGLDARSFPRTFEEAEADFAQRQKQILADAEARFSSDNAGEARAISPSLANATAAEALLKFHLLPVKLTGLDRSACLAGIAEADQLQAKGRDIRRAALSIADSAATTTSTEIAAPEVTHSWPDAEMTFLGTGSAVPSKYRNVSSTLLRYTIPGAAPGAMLFDAGEGTVGQLYRAFGPAFADVLRNLKIVYVSHMHADHHLGLVRVLLWQQQLLRSDGNHHNSQSNNHFDAQQQQQQQQQEAQPRTVVVGPACLGQWLREYSALEPLVYRFVEAASLSAKQRSTPATAASVAATTAASPPPPPPPLPWFEKIGFANLVDVPVRHCYDAHGAVVYLAGTGDKIVLSGDTRPCRELVEHGHGATLLVHEATFADELAQDAAMKSHSTTSEAVQVGRDMQARCTLLTHFSQRYPKIPVLDDASVLAVAFDFMRVHIAEASRLASLMPALKLVFAEEAEEADETDANGNADADADADAGVDAKAPKTLS